MRDHEGGGRRTRGLSRPTRRVHTTGDTGPENAKGARDMPAGACPGVGPRTGRGPGGVDCARPRRESECELAHKMPSWSGIFVDRDVPACDSRRRMLALVWTGAEGGAGQRSGNRQQSWRA